MTNPLDARLFGLRAKPASSISYKYKWKNRAESCQRGEIAQRSSPFTTAFGGHGDGGTSLLKITAVVGIGEGSRRLARRFRTGQADARQIRGLVHDSTRGLDGLTRGVDQ
jgi:hypothetical protein